MTTHTGTEVDVRILREI